MLGLSILRIIQVGFKGLRLHKLRSGLTMLGMIIGVWAVITLVAIGGRGQPRCAGGNQGTGRKKCHHSEYQAPFNECPNAGGLGEFFPSVDGVLWAQKHGRNPYKKNRAGSETRVAHFE